MYIKVENFWSLLLRPGRAVSVPDGTLEALKWLALASMFYDHGVRLLGAGGIVGNATSFGRLAFPLFAFIIAYNLSRAGSGRAVYERTIKRLISFGLLSLPVTYYFFGAEFLNILFTFALAIGIVWLLEGWRSWWRVLLAAGILGFSPWVEYGFPGVLLILSFFAWQRFGLRIPVIFFLIGAFSLLNMANGSFWALAVLPIIWLASVISLDIKRSKWLFYVVYPLHLWILMGIHWFFAR